jgi:hypothetical protein
MGIEKSRRDCPSGEIKDLGVGALIDRNFSKRTGRGNCTTFDGEGLYNPASLVTRAYRGAFN